MHILKNVYNFQFKYLDLTIKHNDPKKIIVIEIKKKNVYSIHKQYIFMKL